MEITNKRLVMLALIVGVLAASLAYFYLTKAETVSQELEPAQTVIVAKEMITPKTAITKEMIEYKTLKVSSILPSTYSNEEEVIGKYVKETIYPGETIIHERIADEKYGKKHLAYSIPKGYRALTLPYNPVMGVAGFIQPGDFVDIIGTYAAEQNPSQKDTSKIVLQNVLILAIGQQTSVDINQDKTSEATITIAVTPKDAERITFTDELASIRLILRPINEEGKPGTNGMTKETIFTP